MQKGSEGERGGVRRKGARRVVLPLLLEVQGKGLRWERGLSAAPSLRPPEPAPLKSGKCQLSPNLDFHFFVSCRLIDSLEIKFYFSKQTRPRPTSHPQRTQVTRGPTRDTNPSSGSPQRFQPPDPHPFSQAPRPLPAPPPHQAGGSGQPRCGPRRSRSQSPQLGTVFLSSALK